MRIVGLILAGGEGQRMGGADKALLALAGRPMLEHVIERFSPQVDDLALSANGDASRFAAFDLAVLADTASHGPLSGVLAGLDWAFGLGATALVSAAVDTPFLPCDLVPRLVWAAEAAPCGVAVARSGGRDHPTLALWPTDLRNPLRDALAQGRYRVMDFARAQEAASAEFDEGTSFLNINTPGDLARAEALLRGAA
jgi:molybdopterin-guanine dinucleotide biosynthesis protein A